MRCHFSKLTQPKELKSCRYAKAESAPHNSYQVYRRLLSYVAPYKTAFFFAILGNLLYGVIDAGFVKFVEPLLDKGFVSHDQSFIQWIPFVVVGIFLARGLANFLSTFFMGWVSRNVVMNLRQKMFHHLLKLPATYYDKSTSGTLLSKITYNVEQVAEASSDALTVLVRESCTALGLFVVMLSVSFRLTLLFFVALPIMATVMYFVSKRLRMVSSRIQDSMGGVTHVAEEAIEAQKIIKAYDGQAYERERFDAATQKNRRQEMKLIVTSALSIPFVQVVGSIALAAAIYLATLTSTGDASHVALTPGEFTTFIGAMILLLKPIKQLTKVNSNIQKGIAGAASIFAFLDEKPEVDLGSLSMKQAKGKIEFQNVSFNYSESPQFAKESTRVNTLEDISFAVEPGEIIAIVGRSGGGKTSLVNLLPRFYDARGDILLDGVDIKEIKLQDLRRQFSVVSQQVTLFNDTVAKNIAYGIKDISQEEIIQAADSAHAMDFIQQLPEGLETVIGENGVRLSGGQRQRLAIARAILKKAPVLILDEATSALDTESERKIQDALERLMHTCTSLVIAHRLSTVENADRIMVIDDGKIVEMGTHAELMGSKGLYAALRVMQYQKADGKQQVA